MAAASSSVRLELEAELLPGRLLAELSEPIEPGQLRTAQDVVELRHEAEAASLDDLRAHLRGLELPELADAESFRVEGRLAGEPGFTRRELAGAAGAVLQRRHGTPVDLERPDLLVWVELVHGRLLTGIPLNRESLDRRLRRGRALRVSLKPTIAAAMIRSAGAQRGAPSLLDPCCGAATIPVEAVLANSRVSAFGSDWDEATVEAARGTIANHGVDVKLQRCDARELGAGWSRRFDRIVTNPPYGLRVGRRLRLDEFYLRLLRGCAEVLEPGGRVVWLTPRRRAIERAVAELPFEIRQELELQLGDLRPRIYLLDPS